ncbi:MAG TPA: Uma2 family endonuclease [Chloroflexia bacterium]|nr:Uma2 family endonuclease [Chloroflexia bacterium]
MAVKASNRAICLVTPEGDIIGDSDVLQGTWNREQYLRLTNYSRRLIEFTDGALEVLPMPTYKHQLISQFLLLALYAFLRPRRGVVMYAPLRLQIGEGKFREPDLMVAIDENDPRLQNAYWLGADIVLEIVSADDPERDTIIKRADYAEGGIPEYWIVNPLDETVTVLRLEEAEYVEHGQFRRGEMAASALLEGFALSVDAIFDA